MQSTEIGTCIGVFYGVQNKQKKYAVVTSHVSKNGKASCTIGGQRVGPLLRFAGRELGSASKTGEFQDCRIRPPTQGTLSHHGPKENAIFHAAPPKHRFFSERKMICQSHRTPIEVWAETKRGGSTDWSRCVRVFPRYRWEY